MHRMTPPATLPADAIGFVARALRRKLVLEVAGL